MALFSETQLADLRTSYATIESVDPCLPVYGKMTALLDGLNDQMLVQVSKAEIKWLSSLALNRVNRRGIK